MGREIYICSTPKKYQNVGMYARFEERPPRGLPIIHGFLALLLSHHSGKIIPEIGHAVGDAIDRYYFGGEIERDISDIKKNPEEFAALIAKELKKNYIITDEKKAKEAILKGLPPIIRIAEKLWPENHDPEHLEKASNALYKGVEDPIHILKQAGIDIEPELEELRNIIAEISGKKPKRTQKPKREKKGAIQSAGSFKTMEITERWIPSEVLAIAKALEFSDFSEKAMKKAEEELLKLIDRLIGEEDAQALFHAVKLLRLIQRGDVGRIKKFGA